MCVVGKQHAEAPESSAAWMASVVSGPKVTLSVVLLTGLTCITSLVFKTDVGVFVDIVDREESDDPAVVTVPNPTWFKEKSEVDDDARLQDPRKRSVSRLKRSFLMSCHYLTMLDGSQMKFCVGPYRQNRFSSKMSKNKSIII